jgi:hypothetical protein
LIGTLKVIGEYKGAISLGVEARNGPQGAATLARLHGGSAGFDILTRRVTHALTRAGTAEVMINPTARRKGFGAGALKMVIDYG